MEGVVAAAAQLGARAFELNVHRGECAAAVVGDDDCVALCKGFDCADAYAHLSQQLRTLVAERGLAAAALVVKHLLAVGAAVEDGVAIARRAEADDVVAAANYSTTIG